MKTIKIESALSDELKEIKPCPFCGGKPYLKRKKKNEIYLKCSTCGIGMNQATIKYGLDWLENKMIEIYNKRV